MAIIAELGPELEGVITTLVESGRYPSESEILREGVRLVREKEARLAVRGAALARGKADAEAGRVQPAGAVFDRLEAKYAGLTQRME